MGSRPAACQVVATSRWPGSRYCPATDPSRCDRANCSRAPQTPSAALGVTSAARVPAPARPRRRHFAVCRLLRPCHHCLVHQPTHVPCHVRRHYCHRASRHGVACAAHRHRQGWSAVPAGAQDGPRRPPRSIRATRCHWCVVRHRRGHRGTVLGRRLVRVDRTPPPRAHGRGHEHEHVHAWSPGPSHHATRTTRRQRRWTSCAQPAHHAPARPAERWLLACGGGP